MNQSHIQIVKLHVNGMRKKGEMEMGIGNWWKDPRVDWHGETLQTCQEELNMLRASLPDLVECDKCGCLLKKGTAIEGKSEIRNKQIPATPPVYRDGIYWYSWGNASYVKPEEYIHQPYFCKVHAPKEKCRKR